MRLLPYQPRRAPLICRTGLESACLSCPNPLTSQPSCLQPTSSPLQNGFEVYIEVHRVSLYYVITAILPIYINTCLALLVSRKPAGCTALQLPLAGRWGRLGSALAVVCGPLRLPARLAALRVTHIHLACCSSRCRCSLCRPATWTRAWASWSPCSSPSQPSSSSSLRGCPPRKPWCPRSSSSS